jgi:Tfp pilus assembly protein PilV
MISNRNEKGQAILLVVVAMALFLIGALGLAT